MKDLLAKDYLSSKNALDDNKCEIGKIWEVLGKRWSLLILKNLSTKEVIRFNELKKALQGISSTVLSERLLDIERNGLIKKKIYPEVPPRVEYSLTPQAKELEVILKDLNRWCGRWKSPELKEEIVATVSDKRRGK